MGRSGFLPTSSQVSSATACQPACHGTGDDPERHEEYPRDSSCSQVGESIVGSKSDCRQPDKKSDEPAKNSKRENAAQIHAGGRSGSAHGRYVASARATTPSMTVTSIATGSSGTMPYTEGPT